jgi:uncharacterized protein DUF6808
MGKNYCIMKKLLLLLLPVLTQAQTDTICVAKSAVQMRYAEMKADQLYISNLKAALSDCEAYAIKADLRLNKVIDNNSSALNVIVALKEKEAALKVESAVLVERNKRIKRWGIGAQAGATYDGETKPYIGVGISYNLIRF